MWQARQMQTENGYIEYSYQKKDYRKQMLYLGRTQPLYIVLRT